ncbi:hypothetical protein D3C71_795240 [compost metagenome]
MEAGDLLIALLGDGVAFNGARTDSIERFQFVSRLKQRLPFLNRLFALDDIIKLIEFMLIQGKRDTELANAAILAMDSTTARLNASYNSLFRDHRSAQALIDIGQF